jgi:hypothetical protein
MSVIQVAEQYPHHYQKHTKFIASKYLRLTLADCGARCVIEKYGRNLPASKLDFPHPRINGILINSDISVRMMACIFAFIKSRALL